MDKSQKREEHRATREVKRQAHEDEMVKLRGKREGKKWAFSLGLMIPFLLIVVSFAAVAYVLLVLPGRSINQTDTMAAKAILKAAAVAADQFASDHNNSYGGMTAGDLKAIDSKINWADGAPNPGQVGIVSAEETTFKLVYKDSTGGEFQAARDKPGAPSFTDVSGNPI
ncbi:MAG: hypothetical protein WC891_04090 [Actinomycetota bacterium]